MWPCQATDGNFSEPVIQAQHGRLAVFASGGGSNLRVLHEACVSGDIDAEVVVVVSEHPDSGAVQFAKQNSIDVFIYSPVKTSDPAIHDDLLKAMQQTHSVNLICLAGFLKLVPPQVVQAYRRRILNIHPALLPAFGGKGLYGLRVHEAVLKSGARFSGCTVHFVDEDYDSGPILAQACLNHPLSITPEQLAQLILREEHRLYIECVAAIVEGRVSWNANGVPLIWEAS
ncbi:hypothetical protein WJX73_000885 [Symbiochloris irregularis]|uniref:phosphoribosylglycinamide formyltransferase 1 n=1 Tax=Symbiochloris irregularis TaxID=706552 RepID=A0AAW1P1H5_9CHLO